MNARWLGLYGLPMLLLVVLPMLAAIPALTVWPLTFAPSWGEALWQTLSVTLASTLVVIMLALWLAQHIHQGRNLSALTSILATPHVAFTVGLLWLFAPTGELIRLLHAATELFAIPPMGWPLPEKSLVTLTLVLVLKELPFLLLMALVQQQHLPFARWQLQAQSLGWSPRRIWWGLLVPALLPRLGLPIAAIMIYSLSVVDIPLMVGPNTPSLLAVEVFEQQYQWRADTLAQSGAWLLVGLGVLLLGGLKLLLPTVITGIAWWRERSHKQGKQLPLSISKGLLKLLFALGVLVLIGLLLQSLAGAWFYPRVLPSQWELARWGQEWPYLQPLLLHSFGLALGSAVLSVLAAVAVLERQRQRGQTQLQLLPLLALLLPQVPLVLGWQQWLGQGNSALWVIWSHAIFGFPYAYLVMHGAWVRFDARWLYQAQSLGYSSWQAWYKVLVPLQKAPLIMALVLAFSVSIAQYLPTLWLAGGTLPTLTTETVSIASGGDWRVASLYALMQTALPMLLLLLGWFLLWRAPAVKNKEFG